ncbi:hypothetical protein AwWohl_10940 [Gammaproteobacteria bacterium]|nr:hypothetical protein AwWohl_10940 [Gammaproteobacteria bacterium]
MNTPEAIIAQFPTRPLNVTKVMAVSPKIAIVIGIIVLLLLFLIPYLGLPGLIHDYEISKNPVEVNAYIDGKCSSQVLIFTHCDITLKYRGKEIERSIFFIDIKLDDYSVSAIASRDNPDLLTIDLAIDKMISRSILLAICFGLILFLGISIITGSRNIKRMHQLLKSINDNRLYPVLVPVSSKSIYGVNTVEYTWSINQVTQKYFATFKEKKEGGVLIVPTTDPTKVYALGVSINEQTAPILLNETLTRIDLTEDERAKLLDAIYKKA